MQLLARDHPDADAAVRDEVDEPERGEPAQRLADRRPADLELLGELLLAKDASGRELAGDDRLLDHERDVVGLGAVEAHVHECTPSNCCSSVEPRSASVEALPPVTAWTARSK